MIPIYDGIRNTAPKGRIDLKHLYELIQNGTHKGQVETIRHLKRKGDELYKAFKETLPCITPQVDVKVRKLDEEHFTENFICFTGLFYFDIDNVVDVLSEKQRIINQYGSQVALVCISPSGSGITILVRVSNEITKGNFLFIWNTIRHTILKDEKVDMRATGIGRAMFVSYDPDVFINNDCVIDVELEDKNIGTQPNTYEFSKYNSLVSDFSNKNYRHYHVYSLDDILANLITKTIVPVSNPVVEFKEVEVLDEIRIMFKIEDTYKHSIYYRIIHQLYYLNPDVEIDYIYSYLFFINNTKARVKMQTTELIRYFNIIISHIKSTGEYYLDKRIKRVHFNSENKDISKEEKKSIASVLNGLFTRLQSRKKIDRAITILQKQGIKTTNRAVAKLIGMSVDTVSDRKKDPPIDMNYEVSLFN